MVPSRPSSASTSVPAPSSDSGVASASGRSPLGTAPPAAAIRPPGAGVPVAPAPVPAGRGLTRRWRIRPEAGGTGLAERILRARGRHDPAELIAFLDPKLTRLHDPGLMPGAADAAARIVAAVRAGEPVAIYGDYDVDGMTATAVLVHVLRALEPAADLRTYVPHRLEEGYGLNAPALEQLAAEGARVVITVDCGITAVAEAEAAAAAGIDLIITDHHELPADGPLPAARLVHPRLPGSAYPCPDLCGAGVAFKLAWMICRAWAGSDRVGEMARRALVDVLPLVALGTIADVVPLTDENRILTSFGLRTIRACPLPGLRALITASSLDGADIDDEKVGFVLAPRLNACGRMGHARDAVHLLTDADAEEAGAIARRFTAMNEERRKTERRIFDEAARMAEDAGMTRDDRRVIVLAREDWHPGVIGIVCSRLVERYGRPAVLLQREDGQLKGSARSIDGYSIHAGLSACGEHLDRFGGHEAAAGLALSADRLADFVRDLTAHANAHIPAEDLVPRLILDVDATIESLTSGEVERVRRLGPFGRGNRRPVIRLADVLIDEVRTMGTDDRHLAVTVRSRTEGGGGGRMRAVWFGAGEHAASLVPGERVDLAIEPRINRWRDRESVEGHVRDVRRRRPGE